MTVEKVTKSIFDQKQIPAFQMISVPQVTQHQMYWSDTRGADFLLLLLWGLFCFALFLLTNESNNYYVHTYCKYPILVLKYFLSTLFLFFLQHKLYAQNSLSYFKIKESFRNYIHKKAKGKWYLTVMFGVDFMSPI